MSDNVRFQQESQQADARAAAQKARKAVDDYDPDAAVPATRPGHPAVPADEPAGVCATPATQR